MSFTSSRQMDVMVRPMRSSTYSEQQENESGRPLHEEQKLLQAAATVGAHDAFCCSLFWLRHLRGLGPRQGGIDAWSRCSLGSRVRSRLIGVEMRVRLWEGSESGNGQV